MQIGLYKIRLEDEMTWSADVFLPFHVADQIKANYESKDHDLIH